MKFEEIKNKWNADHTNEIPIPENLQKLRKAQHPLYVVKKNMKHELFWQLVGLAIIALVPPVIDLPSKTHLGIYYICFLILLALSCYYFYGFRSFYRSIDIESSASKDQLLEMYYQLRLNIERYKSFSFLLLPFIIAFWSLFIASLLEKKKISATTFSSNTIYVGIAIGLLLMTIFYIGVIIWWVNRFYGKYATKIKAVLEELKEEAITGSGSELAI
jgi:hypothetical protein